MLIRIKCTLSIDNVPSCDYKMMNNCLNLFQLADITSLPEEPHPYINYYTVNDKFNILEIDISTKDKTAISVAKELAKSFMSCIVYLLRSELNNIIHYDEGLKIFSDVTSQEILEINYDTKQNYDNILQWKYLRVNLIFTTEFQSKPQISEDIFDNITDIFVEIYNNNMEDIEGKSIIFSSDSPLGHKLNESEKLSLWKLCYATFYLNYVNSIIKWGKAKIIIPFNDMETQMSILKDLFSNVTFNRKFASRYNNTKWTFHICGEISALHSELIVINNETETMISTVSSCNNSIDEIPLANIITNQFIL